MKKRILKKEKLNSFYAELEKPDNWRPDFTKLAKKTGIPVSTIHNRYTNMRKEGKIMIETKVRVFNEVAETQKAFKKWKVKSNNAEKTDREVLEVTS